MLALFASCGTRNTVPQRIARRSIFTDITEKSRLHFTHDPAVDGSYFYPEVMTGGAALFDYDNDGDLDIYLVNGAAHGSHGSTSLKNRLFRQESDGTFTDVTDSSGLGDTGYGMGVAIGDIDNDGDQDVYITNFGPDKLYRNNGDGTFTDISNSAGITNAAWGASAVFLDYNRDGFLDIYVANYVKYDPTVICTDRAGRRDYCGPSGYKAESDILYRNNGNGTFTDVSKEAGIASVARRGLGVVSADFNGDHYPDIYVANDEDPNLLWINQRNGTFVESALVMGAAVNALGQPEAGMGIAMGDADGDARLDFLVTHLRNETNTFYRASKISGFEDATSVSGLGGPSIPYTGFGTGFFDYDQDGDLDVAVVNGRVTRGNLLTKNHTPNYWDAYAEPNLLFENDGNGHFRDVSNEAGAFTSYVENHRGLAFGDIDNDGDIDLLVTNDGGPARLFRNDAPGKGHWLMIRAIENKRDAIGAEITVTAGARKWTRVLQPGYSYLCSNDPRVHFGLGGASAVDRIVIVWPDGSTESFAGMKADQRIMLEKGKGS